MKAIYAGSFNLFHAGHYYVYNQACEMFGRDNVFLCVAINKKKKIDPDFIKWTLNPITPNVIVADGLVVNENPDVLIRGLRDATDLSIELTMADWNKTLGVKTIFVPCSGELRHISSSALRELSDLGVLIDNETNIPSDVKLSYQRWLKGKTPSRKMICGKIAVGKSTYIKRVFGDYGDCDKLIWQFFSEREQKFLKGQFSHLIETGERLGYSTLKNTMAKQIDWDALFTGYHHYEASALGQWIEYIPFEILTQFQIIELEVDLKQRTERIQKRGLSMEYVEKVDRFYKSPYFVDERINIG